MCASVLKFKGRHSQWIGFLRQRETATATLVRRPDAVRAGLLAATVALIAGYQLTVQISQSLDTPAMAAPRPALVAAAEAVPAPADPFESLQIDVRPGDTLDGLFRDSNLSLVDLAEILQLDEARKNLRILRPGRRSESPPRWWFRPVSGSRTQHQIPV